MCKKLIYLISFVVVLALAGNASAALDPNLVAYYTFNGDALDTGLPPATDGVLYGGPTWTNERAWLGGEIDLDNATDQNVQIPHIDKLNITRDLTVAFWLRVDDPNWGGVPYQGIIFKGTTWDNTGWKFERGSQTGMSGGGIHWCVSPGDPWSVYGQTEVNDGQWHHVVGVYNYGTGLTAIQRLYIDGVLDGSASAAPAHLVLTNTLPINISVATTGDANFLDGGIDDLRIYNRAFSAEEVVDLYNYDMFKAGFPNPYTGKQGVAADANLSWTAGKDANKHDVYFGTDVTAVTNATTSTPGVYKGRKSLADVNYDPPGLLDSGVTYYWRIDEVNIAGLPEWPGHVWSFATSSYIPNNPIPTNPIPTNGFQYAAPDTQLTWTAGCTAVRHKIYFGTASNPPYISGADVNMPVVTYNPPGDLVRGRTYYWKITAFDYPAGGSGSSYASPIWSFRVTNGLRGWWKFDDNEGNTPDDSSGNNNHAAFRDYPGTLPTWTDGRLNKSLGFSGGPVWAQVTRDPNFDIADSITVALWVKIDNFGANNQEIVLKGTAWNSYVWKFERNDATGSVMWGVESGLPFVVRGTTSINDSEWHHLVGTYDGTTGDQILYIDGVYENMGFGTPHSIPIKPLLIQIGSNGLVWAVDDLRVYDYVLTPTDIWNLYNIPWPIAHDASPANRSTPPVELGLDKMLTLSWTAGTYAVTHRVYFGTDFNDVNNANTSTPVIYRGSQLLGDVDYVVGPLEIGRTYYWRIDEVNDACAPYLWKGDIWRFTTANYFRVDNFEDYNNSSPNRIWDPNGWVAGGLGFAGYSDINYAELIIIHGGQQSMPFDYNNLSDSNATHTFTSSQDWTAEGVKSLEVWFRGWPVSVGSWVESVNEEEQPIHTITASGADIWAAPSERGSGFRDEFHYAYKEITGTYGTVTIIAKVTSVSPADPWSKAGVMMRQSLDPNSKNGLICVTPSNGTAWQYRAVAGGTPISYDHGSTPGLPALLDYNAPSWVRLDISAPGYVWAYYSDDGVNWLPTPDAPELTTLPIYVGLAVTAHNMYLTCTATFSDVSITADGDLTISEWSNQDIGIHSNVLAPLYATLEDAGGDKATIPYTTDANGALDPNGVLDPNWQPWVISLNDFKVNNPSLNLESIKKITLGVGPATPNGTGTLFFDDIRLYRLRCMSSLKPTAGDFNGDCSVDYLDLQTLASNWLTSPVNPNIDLNDDSAINFKDFALMASNWLAPTATLMWP